MKLYTTQCFLCIIAGSFTISFISGRFPLLLAEALFSQSDFDYFSTNALLTRVQRYHFGYAIVLYHLVELQYECENLY